MSNQSPDKIGRYEIRRELGRGTMGVVYEAHDPKLDRRVALKTIHLALVPSAEERVLFEKRFFAEAEAAARFSHPGIVVVYDVGRDPATGTLYMALEYLEGRTLADIVRAAEMLDWRDALRTTARVAEALHAAHSAGIIHRDIKPANIMLLENREPKIMDFGIAKLPFSALTVAGQVLGTPSSMSPEQAMGEPLDARSDLFSLGTVLYELLTGTRAFPGVSLPKILELVTRQDPLPPSRLVPEIPPQVDDLVMRALAKEPSERYPSGKAMAEDIEGILAAWPPRQRAVQTATTGGGTTDLESELAALIPHVPEETEVPPPAVTSPSAASASTGPEADRRSGARTVAMKVAVATVAVIAVLAGVAVPWLRRGRQSEAAPTLAPRAVASAPGTRIRGPKVPSPSADLLIVFEHPPRSASLRVLVDRDVAFHRSFDDRPTAGFEKRLAIRPGKHDIGIEVSWEGRQKAQSIAGDFPSGTTRRLEIGIGRLRKNLSLEWK